MKTVTKFKILLILSVATALVVMLYSKAVYMVSSAAEAEFSSFSSVAFYKSTEEVLQDSNFDDIMEKFFDSEGNVTFVSTNAVKVNLLCKTLTERTFSRFDEYIKGGVCIPAGAFSGIGLLAGVGGAVKMKTFTVSSVTCDFYQESEGLGINQTRFKYYLVLRPEFTFLTPFCKKSGSLEIKYLLYDFLIVGKVPDFYISSK